MTLIPGIHFPMNREEPDRGSVPYPSRGSIPPGRTASSSLIMVMLKLVSRGLCWNGLAM